MGLTLDDCKRLGIPLELHPATSGRSERDVLRKRFGIGEEVPPSQTVGDGMNKLERKFSEVLEANRFYDNVLAWHFEKLKLRIAGRTWYTPDFLVEVYAGRPAICEVKGHMEDDAAVKLKAAADLYPCFRWLLVRREGRHGWDVREVTSRGIGTSPVRVPWIHGG
jgi:hypothetical protein